MNINYILISLATLSSLNLAMELDQPKENPIIVQPTNKVSSLRKLAARSFCQAMHPNNTSCTLDQVKRLADKASIVPQELKNYLAKRLAIENADVFARLQEPKLLTKRSECTSCQVSKDTKKVWFLEGSWQSDNRLVCLDIPTATETVVDLNKTSYKILTFDDMGETHFAINEDGCQVAFACRRHQGQFFQIKLVTYNLNTKEFTEIINLPTHDVDLKAFANNRVLLNRTTVQNHNDPRTYIIDCAQKQIKTLPHQAMAMSPSGKYVMTYNNQHAHIAIHGPDDTALKQVPHVLTNCMPAFNEDESCVSSVESDPLGSNLRIWDLKSGSLLHTIRYPHSITRVIFKKDSIITCMNVNHSVAAIYKTNLKTSLTKLLVKNGNRFAINHDGALSLTSCNSGLVQMNVTETQKMINHYADADESYIRNPGFVNNDEHIMISEYNMIGSFRNMCLKRYSTHLAVTKNKTVEQLLAMCLSARPKKEHKSWYGYIMDFIGNFDG